ncbi:MAG TPA: phosphoribosylaminoimidazolesuccinocarboxamide synthase [Candidatus Omnitrophica bacterium]|nr:phosphoribosylaminoimidazolesuccinocarboxamide synthase [Candidatus Omnitrophota bacterium]
MELLETNIAEYPLFARGKVRDVYDLSDKLLIVATDRISAFDCVMPNGIPRKGRILTQMSVFWFGLLSDVVENHLITANVDEFPEPLRKYRAMLEERSMLVRKAKRIDVECVVRGYLAGSGWKEYKQTGTVCGIALPKGLKESSKLPTPIFTPSTKADSGHDENVSFDKVVDLVGKQTAEKLRDLTLAIYGKAQSYADTKGIIIADTKFEFGLLDGRIILIDEILSPDSSRFWPKVSYAPGRPQNSFDKQFVRDYLESIKWNKKPPAPAIPPDIVGKTLDRYKEAYERLCL